MHKFATVALGLLILAVPAAAMDVDELIAKNIEAMGGLEKIESIETMVFEGAIMAQGMEIPFTMTQKRPDKMKIEASFMGMTMTQCFADGKGWAVNPMLGSTEPQPMEGLEAKSFALQADVEGALVNYKDKGYTVTYAGEAEVDGVPVYRLTLDTQTGIVMDMNLDKESFLVILQESRMTVEGQEIVTQTRLKDYKSIDGLLMPHSIETSMGGMPVNALVIKSGTLNGEIDDSVFAVPEAAAAE